MKKLTKLNQLKQDKKGFTLIEIVIVLVIIAILAAMLVPSMAGWIEDSQKKSFVQEARSAMTATQAEIANIYARGGDVPPTGFTDQSSIDGISKKVGRTVKLSDINWGLDGDQQINKFTYVGEKYTVTWEKTAAKPDGAWGEATKNNND